MTPEAQRIAIAEECGLRKEASRFKKAITHGGWSDDFFAIPDYTEDLNAMHEAEKELPDACAYGETLREVWMKNEPEPHVWVETHEWHASASVRAEAFLRVKGKWV